MFDCPPDIAFPAQAVYGLARNREPDQPADFQDFEAIRNALQMSLASMVRGLNGLFAVRELHFTLNHSPLCNLYITPCIMRR